MVSDPDPAMLADAGRHRVVVTVEDGMRQGGAGMFLADALRASLAFGTAPPVISLGIPRAYIAQGKPDRILAQLGLDRRRAGAHGTGGRRSSHGHSTGNALRGEVPVAPAAWRATRPEATPGPAVHQATPRD